MRRMEIISCRGGSPRPLPANLHRLRIFRRELQPFRMLSIIR